MTEFESAGINVRVKQGNANYSEYEVFDAMSSNTLRTTIFGTYSNIATFTLRRNNGIIRSRCGYDDNILMPGNYDVELTFNGKISISFILY
jgi:hypothetical protein